VILIRTRFSEWQARPGLAGLLLLALCGFFGSTPCHAAGKDVPTSRAQPAVEPRVALIIGNGEYSFAPLKNPTNDARAMAERLSALRFRVTRLENATQEEMYQAIRAFGDDLRGGGVGLFYFSGHALQVRGRNYLLPVRATIQREDEIVYRTVDMGQVLDKMETARNRVNIVILDACRNNPFGREYRSVQPGLAVVDAPSNTLIGFATAPGSVASDGAGVNGLYTHHLLGALAEPGLRLEDAMKKVRSAVRLESAGRQVPWESTSLEVDFYFDPLPQQTVGAAARGPDALTVELAFWDSVKGSSDPEDFRAYLQRYPSGQFAALATNRLRALPPRAVAVTTGAPAPPVPTPAAAAAPAALASNPAPSGLPSRTVARAPADVLALALSRNGSQLLSAAADRVLRLSDVASGRELRRFGGVDSAGKLHAVAISSDARLLLAGGSGRTLTLWDAASGAELARLAAHTAAVSAVAFGPTGRYAVSGAEDGDIVLWDLPGGAPLRRVRAHEQRVASVAISPDGRWLITAGADGQVRLWDVGTFDRVRSFGPSPDAAAAPVVAAAFGGFARRVQAIDARGDVTVWDTASGAVLRRFATSAATPLLADFAADGASLLVAAADGELVAWDMAAASPQWRSALREPRITALALGPRGAVAATDDRRLQVWATGP
jgi:WD40 repeat protein